MAKKPPRKAARRTAPAAAPAYNSVQGRVLLVVTGGIAAYKTPELVRRLKERGLAVRCVLTRGGKEFVTPLALGAVSGDKVYEDLFSLTDEHEMGHIRLARETDVVVIAPASADVLAKMAAGLCDSLAATLLLATDKPIMAAPAMNVRMWQHAATQANVETLKKRGVTFIGPAEGDMACGEWGPGRMTEPHDIAEAVAAFLKKGGAPGSAPLSGRHALVTSGPTWEALDPVRFIANRSSGKQGHAIARALAAAGARVTLVTGPVALPDPAGMKTIHVESAREMLKACERALPVDVAVCAAAVADWRAAAPAKTKIKKGAGGPPGLALVENPDILKTLARAGKRRPKLLIGFAAETEDLIRKARAKFLAKGCDWILANDVSKEAAVFGSDVNTVHLVTHDWAESWPKTTKDAIATRLAQRIAETLLKKGKPKETKR